MIVESKEGRLTPAWPRQGGVVPRKHGEVASGSAKLAARWGIASPTALQKGPRRKAGSQARGTVGVVWPEPTPS